MKSKIHCRHGDHEWERFAGYIYDYRLRFGYIGEIRKCWTCNQRVTFCYESREWIGVFKEMEGWYV